MRGALSENRDCSKHLAIHDVLQQVKNIQWPHNSQLTQAARSREYDMTMPIVVSQVRIFTVYTSVFPDSVFKVSTKVPTFRSLILPMRFRHIGVNKGQNDEKSLYFAWKCCCVNVTFMCLFHSNTNENIALENDALSKAFSEVCVYFSFFG